MLIQENLSGQAQTPTATTAGVFAPSHYALFLRHNYLSKINRKFIDILSMILLQ